MIGSSRKETFSNNFCLTPVYPAALLMWSKNVNLDYAENSASTILCNAVYKSWFMNEKYRPERGKLWG